MGIGLILSAVVINVTYTEKSLSKARIEEKARSYGMIYPDEVKSIFDKGEDKND